MILPSRIQILRVPSSASSKSCVTNIIVFPDLLSSFKILIMIWPVSSSRAPVGSPAFRVAKAMLYSGALGARTRGMDTKSAGMEGFAGHPV